MCVSIRPTTSSSNCAILTRVRTRDRSEAIRLCARRFFRRIIATSSGLCACDTSTRGRLCRLSGRPSWTIKSNTFLLFSSVFDGKLEPASSFCVGTADGVDIPAVEVGAAAVSDGVDVTTAAVDKGVVEDGFGFVMDDIGAAMEEIGAIKVVGVPMGGVGVTSEDIGAAYATWERE